MCFAWNTVLGRGDAAHGDRGRMTGAHAVTERVEGGRATYRPGKPIRLLNHRANTVARQAAPRANNGTDVSARCERQDCLL